MTKEDLSFIEDQIGYKFKNIDLLQQAFVRRSYAKENGGEDNEVLEFIGDKVLDFAVVKLLTEKFGSLCSEIPNYNYDFNEYVSDYNEGKLTKIKSDLVNKTMLASRTEELGIANYLIMGKGDELNKVENEISVKEDLFEAILGAVAIDSKWNIEDIQSTVDIMLCPDHYFAKGEGENYVGLIQKWCLRKYNRIPWYHYDSTSMEASWYMPFNRPSTHAKPDTKFYCLLNLGGEIFRGFGKSKSDARKDVCRYTYEILAQQGLLFTIHDEIENPNKNEAINQLETLARRGYFSIPEYEFEEKHDGDGNSIWYCICRIKEIEKSFKSKSSLKKEAKKTVAFNMLNYILENHNEARAAKAEKESRPMYINDFFKTKE